MKQDIPERDAMTAAAPESNDLHRDDLDLARRACTGDESAWRLIYDQTSGPLFNFLCYQTGDRDMALELMQETYVTALQRLDSYRGRGPLGGWLRSIALRKSLDWRRRVALRLRKLTALARENAASSHAHAEEAFPGFGRRVPESPGPPVPQATGRASPPRTRGPALQRGRRSHRLRRADGAGPLPPSLPEHAPVAQQR